MRRSHCRTNPREANPPPRSRRVAPTAQAEQSPKEFNRTIRTRRRALHSQQPDRESGHTLASRCGRGASARPGGLYRAEVAARAQHRKTRSGSADYYLAAVAGGAEDYYLRRGRGAWALAAPDGGLELEGEVAGDDLRAVLDGRDPADGAQLVRGPAEAAAHARLRPDLLGAQVGLAAGRPRPRGRARRGADAHHRAVAAAMAYLEEHAAFLRRGANGIRARARHRPGGGLFHPPRLARRRPCPSQPRAGGQHGPGSTRAASGPSTAGRSTATPRPPATSTRQSCATS